MNRAEYQAAPPMQRLLLQRFHSAAVFPFELAVHIDVLWMRIIDQWVQRRPRPPFARGRYAWTYKSLRAEFLDTPLKLRQHTMSIGSHFSHFVRKGLNQRFVLNACWLLAHRDTKIKVLVPPDSKKIRSFAKKLRMVLANPLYSPIKTVRSSETATYWNSLEFESLPSKLEEYAKFVNAISVATNTLASEANRKIGSYREIVLFLLGKHVQTSVGRAGCWRFIECLVNEFGGSTSAEALHQEYKRARI